MGNLKLKTDQLEIVRSGKQVLSGISFQVQRGEVYALLGGNGAGKSTTLLSFLGFLTPSSGQILVNERNVADNLQATREAIAYLPESASLYEHLNALENLRYFMQLAGLSFDPSRVNEVLDQVSLKHEARTRRLSDYSKGMRQKVAIALAILRDTEILLLDEPTSGLDPGAIDEFHDLIRELSVLGKTVLMVTHDVYGACQVADKIGLLSDGQLVGEFVANEGQRIETESVHRAFSAQPNPRPL